ncbi:hypothetical protein Tco_0174982 [Tanacetum coccineum]
MSNTNTNLQTQTSNALHNAIMEAGGKDRPPMLAPGNYVWWKSRIKRYINTKPNNELIYYCLQNPPYKFKWTEKTVPVAEDNFVGIKSLLDVVRITAAQVYVNTALMKLEVIKNGATLPKTTTVEGVVTEMPITTAEEKAQRRLERFGGNEATKKTQRNLLKQQYENFTAPSSEMLDQTFNRLQKLESQLEILGEKIPQEDVNQKLLRSLSPE